MAGGSALRGGFLSQRWERNQRIAGGRRRGELRSPMTAYPRSPITGVIPWARQKISGAQNLSDTLKFPPGHWALRRRKVRSTPFPPNGENCARSLAPPLQRKPATLGFALGAAFGGLLGGKLPLVRFRRRAWVCRANMPGSTHGIPHLPPSGAPSPKGEGFGRPIPLPSPLGEGGAAKP